MRRIVIVLLCALLLTGCTPKGGDTAPPQGTQAPAEEGMPTYALVVKSVENPYMTTMFGGFTAACGELGVEPALYGPGANGTPTQPELLQALIEQGIGAIAIAANDMDEVSPMLRGALDAGIPIVSLDSMVYPQDRMVHIQQASPEMIGRVLIQACAQMLDRDGDFAILTTTDSMPNQASWVRWMRQELDGNPEQYASMRLVETAYGLDEYEASAAATQALLDTYPELSMIVAPTTVGMLAAAETIKTNRASVRLTGLGLPSEMKPYVMDGTCPWMYLWNPAEVGYLSAYAMDALVRGTLSGQKGEILTAGELGTKVLTGSEDGGTEIVLGNPKVFDATNIAVWSELF